MQTKNIRKIILVLFVIILSLSQSIYIFAGRSNNKRIKVGFFKFAGYHDIDEYGNMGGYGYDFIQMLARFDNDEYQFVGYERGWNEMFRKISGNPR